MKQCYKCKIYRPIFEYHYHSRDKKYSNYCKLCLNKKRKEYYKKYPWKRHFQDLKTRCTNPKCKSFKRYGKMGRKCLITEKEVMKIWIRDKAWTLKQPSIDRIDNDGNYIYNNCRFIEMSENRIKDTRKKILQFDLQGNFIREWKSIITVEKTMGFNHSNISAVCKRKRNSCGGFMWKYK